MTNQQNEKSNNGKRLALVLIALILIAAIAVGAYTYSRYISSKDAAGSADVAFWGYSVEIGNGNQDDDDVFFARNYVSTGVETAGNTGTVIANVATPDRDIVAPGAKGHIQIKVSGISEVNAALEMAIGDNATDIKLGLNNGDSTLYYHPVKFTLTDSNGDPVTINSNNVQNYTLAQLTSTLATTKGNNSFGVIKSGNAIEQIYYLDWEWAFAADGAEVLYNSDGTPSETSIAQADVDKLDTVLGQLAYNAANAENTVLASYGTVKDTAAEANTWTILTGDYGVELAFDLTVTIGQVMVAVD